MEAMTAAPPGAAPAPGALLRKHLEPARDLSAPDALRLEAYRGLTQFLEGNLHDREFALPLHREWMRLSAEAPARRARRPAPGAAFTRRRG